MFDEREVKRALFRLERCTAARVAAFSEADPVEVERYLRTRPDLYREMGEATVDAEDGSSPAWEIVAEAVDTIRAELRHRQLPPTRRQAAELIEDHLRVASGIERIAGDVRALAGASKPEDAEYLEFMEQRLSGIARALRFLESLGADTRRENEALGRLRTDLGLSVS